MKILKWVLIVLAILLAIGFMLPTAVDRALDGDRCGAGGHPPNSRRSRAGRSGAWNKVEPVGTFTFEGADSGVGSRWKWKGDSSRRRAGDRRKRSVQT